MSEKNTEWKPSDYDDFIKNFAYGEDFDSVIHKIETMEIDRSQLIRYLQSTQEIIAKLGSIDIMSRDSRDDILTHARKTINILEREYNKIIKDEALRVYSGNVDLLAKAVNKAFKKNITPPDWDKINDQLMSEKFDALHYYLNRSVFMLDQRVTLFELQGKKELQERVISKILQERGGKNHGQMLDDIMKMLDTHYPAGYLPLPIIRDGKREFRKISLNYYVNTWINDVEGSVHHWAQRSTYLKAGLDLVEIHTGEGESCPICSPEVGHIYSLTGKDPDFKRMDFVLPRHPNCDCFMVPAILDEKAYHAKGKLQESYPKLKNMEHDVFTFAQREGVPFSGFDVFRNAKNPMMAIDEKGVIRINDTTFGNKANSYSDLVEALEKLKKGLSLTLHEHDALLSLSHEFLHIKNPTQFRMLKNPTQSMIIETLTEWVSRNDYDKFYVRFARGFNPKAPALSEEEYKKLMIFTKGYDIPAQRLDKLIAKLGLKENEIKAQMSQVLMSHSGAFLEGLASMLSKKSGKDSWKIQLILKSLDKDNFNFYLKKLL